MSQTDVNEYERTRLKIETGDGLVGEIARVGEVFIGIEDHGHFAMSIDFDLGGSHQGTGLIELGNPGLHTFPGPSLEMLCDLTKMLGPLPGWCGSAVVVLRQDDKLHSRILGIQTLQAGHRVMWGDYV